MERLQRLLFDRLHRHRLDVGRSRRLEQRHGIRRIGLVPLHIGAHVLRGKQSHLNSASPQRSGPVMRRTAGLHHHELHGAVVEPARKLGPRQSCFLNHLPVPISASELEGVLGQINGNGSSIHLGLLLSIVLKPPRPQLAP